MSDQTITSLIEKLEGAEGPSLEEAADKADFAKFMAVARGHS